MPRRGHLSFSPGPWRSAPTAEVVRLWGWLVRRGGVGHAGVVPYGVVRRQRFVLARRRWYPDRGRRRDPAIPPLRHRSADQPYARVCHANGVRYWRVRARGQLTWHPTPARWRARRLATGHWPRGGAVSAAPRTIAACDQPPAVWASGRALCRPLAPGPAAGGKPCLGRRAAQHCGDRSRRAEAAIRSDCPPGRGRSSRRR